MSSKKKRFRAEVQTGGRGRVFVEIPFDVNDVWGRKRRHYVQGKVAGVDYQGSLGSRQGTHFLLLNKAFREQSGVAPGDTVTVTLEPASGEIVPAMPADLAKALARKRRARSFFESLSPFYRKQYVGWIESAKKPETRSSRVAKTVELLEAEKSSASSEYVSTLSTAWLVAEGHGLVRKPASRRLGGL